MQRRVPFAERLGRLVDQWSRDEAIAAAYLFGSRSTGRARADSDVDLAIVLAPMSESERRRARDRELDRATKELGTDAVDLVVLEDAPAVLGHRVLRDGRLLLERDARRRTAVVEAVLRRYLDEAPIRAALDRALVDRVREGRYAR